MPLTEKEFAEIAKCVCLTPWSFHCDDLGIADLRKRRIVCFADVYFKIMVTEVSEGALVTGPEKPVETTPMSRCFTISDFALIEPNELLKVPIDDLGELKKAREDSAKAGVLYHAHKELVDDGLVPKDHLPGAPAYRVHGVAHFGAGTATCSTNRGNGEHLN